MSQENENLIPDKAQAKHEKIAGNLFNASVASFFISNYAHVYAAFGEEKTNMISFYVAVSLGALGCYLMGTSILVKKFGLFCFAENKEAEDVSELESDFRYKV